MVSFAIMVPLNMLFAIMVGSYHNRKFAIMVFAIMVGSYHNRKFAIMVFAIMVWNHSKPLCQNKINDEEFYEVQQSLFKEY